MSATKATPALGFGGRVTGGDDASAIVVTNQALNGTTLFDALAQAKSRSRQGKKSRIVIAAGIAPDPGSYTVEANDLTIEGGGPGSRIMNTLLTFDCTKSDNVLIRNLTFEGAPVDEALPKDAIEIDARQGRGSKGFWIDHCHFEAYFDLNITANADDPGGARPLLVAVSSCYFHNSNPNGLEHENNGAVGIHGSPSNTRTNAYASVYRNVFETVRRRSPRSSGMNYVHAFNNVLLRWGATDSTDDDPDNEQINGMASGHFGRLVAEANYFLAGPVAMAIQVSITPGQHGALTVHENDPILKNMYIDATEATLVGDPIDINAAYRQLGLAVPTVTAMDDTLMLEIRNVAGPQFARSAAT